MDYFHGTFLSCLDSITIQEERGVDIVLLYFIVQVCIISVNILCILWLQPEY